MTTQQAASRLFTTAYTVRKYIRQGKLAAARVGKQYLILDEELTRLLKEMTYKRNNEEV
jgi:excisionase family DNA binding protein